MLRAASCRRGFGGQEAAALLSHRRAVWKTGGVRRWSRSKQLFCFTKRLSFVQCKHCPISSLSDSPEVTFFVSLSRVQVGQGEPRAGQASAVGRREAASVPSPRPDRRDGTGSGPNPQTVFALFGSSYRPHVGRLASPVCVVGTRLGPTRPGRGVAPVRDPAPLSVRGQPSQCILNSDFKKFSKKKILRI